MRPQIIQAATLALSLMLISGLGANAQSVNANANAFAAKGNSFGGGNAFANGFGNGNAFGQGAGPALRGGGGNNTPPTITPTTAGGTTITSIAPTSITSFFNMDRATTAAATASVPVNSIMPVPARADAIQNFINTQIFSGVSSQDAFYLSGNESVSEEEDGLKVVEGHVLLDTGTNGTTVKTPLGQLYLDGNSAAAISIKTNQSMKITALAAGDRQIILSRDGNQLITLGEGEEIEISLNDEFLIPADSSSVIDAALKIDGHKAVKRRISLRPTLAQSFTVAGANITIGAQKYTTRMRSHIKAAAARQMSANARFRPVGFAEVMSGPSTASAPATYLVEAQSIFERQGSEQLSLKSGSLVCDPHQKPVSIDTPFGTLKVKKGTMVVVEVIDSVLRCRVCAGDMVEFESGKRTVKLLPGHELVVANSSVPQFKLIPNDGIARRHGRCAKVDDLTISVSDFSISSMMLYNDLLGGALASMGSGKKQLVDRLLKTAAAIDYVTRSHGPYTYSQSQ